VGWQKKKSSERHIENDLILVMIVQQCTVAADIRDWQLRVMSAVQIRVAGFVLFKG
jgi:hypothetical protein